MELLRSEIPEEYESKETMWIYKENKDIIIKIWNNSDKINGETMILKN